MATTKLSYHTIQYFFKYSTTKIENAYIFNEISKFYKESIAGDAFEHARR